MNGKNTDTARATRALGFKLVNCLCTNTSNVCISPLSISIALQLLLSGAAGATLEELLKVMEVKSPGRDALANDYELVMKELAETRYRTFEGPGSKMEFAIANSIWAHEGVVLHPGFVQHLIQRYRAEARSLNFADPNSREIINAWVSAKTQGRIPFIISELQPANLLVLINCAYFKARWASPFNQALTQMQNFFLADKAVAQVPMMTVNSKFNYFNDGSIEVVEIPYTDKRFGMYVVLPARGANLSNLVAGITSEHWSQWLDRLSSHAGELSMPRFKFEYANELNRYLIQMGIRQAFSNEANFWNMLSPNHGNLPFFRVDQVIHKTFIAVDEEGTEAAAATAITMWGAAAPPPPPPFKMLVDRPFLFVLAEKNTDTILFAGTVYDPR